MAASGAMPSIIQSGSGVGGSGVGGSGVGGSGWRLARAVAMTGQLGVVSGPGLDVVLAHRLQRGDPDGSIRTALAHFPLPGCAGRILDRYFVPGGIGVDQRPRPVPRWGPGGPRASELMVAANFVEVYLARQGHGGQVGVGYPAGVGYATPAAVYGAMLAGVDHIVLGPGDPAGIMALLAAFAADDAGTPVRAGADASQGGRPALRLDPAAWFAGPPPPLARPRLLLTVTAAASAQALAGHPATRPDGFVLDLPGNGRHGTDRMVAAQADGVAALGVPFWLAGGPAEQGRSGEPGRAGERGRSSGRGLAGERGGSSERGLAGERGGLDRARSLGAVGIQVGTAFTLCRESGIDPDLRHRLVEAVLAATLGVPAQPYPMVATRPARAAAPAPTLAQDAASAGQPQRCSPGRSRSAAR